jgi:hypothetical protein
MHSQLCVEFIEFRLQTVFYVLCHCSFLLRRRFVRRISLITRRKI